MREYKYRRLDKQNAAALLVDHQSGLISLVQDYSPGEFKHNVLALAACAQYFKLPTVLTTSIEDGPNGPLVPELKEMFPQAAYIPRSNFIPNYRNLMTKLLHQDRADTSSAAQPASCGKGTVGPAQVNDVLDAK